MNLRPCLFGAASLALLAGCANFNLIVESTASSDPALTPHSSFTLVANPDLIPEQQRIMASLVEGLRQAKLPIVEPGREEYIVRLEFRSQVDQLAAFSSRHSHTSAATASTTFLCFFAYSKSDMHSGRVVPVWIGEVSAHSSVMSGHETEAVVELFRHLGEKSRQTTTVHRGLG